LFSILLTYKLRYNILYLNSLVTYIDLNPTLSAKTLEKFKKTFEEMSKREWSDEEVREGADNLMRFFSIVFDIALEEQRRKEELKKHPKGFHLEGESAYSCKICSRYIKGEDTWYDRYGIKCMDCQRNLDKKVIPKKICKNDNLWFKDWQLQSDLGVHAMTAKKLRREGKLIARELKDTEGNVYFRVYMVEENRDFLKNTKWKEKNRTNPIMVDDKGPIF
jgi:hypothetical protein